jgi:hypothetical protein
MAKVKQDLFENKPQATTEPSAERIRALFAGIKEVGGAVWDGMAPMVNHGRSEAAAALFNGNAYVMYQRGTAGVEQGQDQPLHGPDVKQPEVQQPEIERDGLGM